MGASSTDNALADIRNRLDYLNTRLTRMEQIVDKWAATLSETEKANRQFRADQSVYVEDLRSELRTLQGSLDVLRHEMEETGKKDEKIRGDMDQRLAELERRTNVPPSASMSAPTARPGIEASADDDLARYNQILKLVLEKKDYDTAIVQFDQFLRDFPQSTFSANAQYWKAEGYFAKGDFARSITEFQKVVDQYPKSDKVCDARLKQGFAFIERGDKANAKLFLQETSKRCANSTAATKADERLRTL